jgi:RHS repeat-associated protein
VTVFLYNLRGELVEERVMDGPTAKKINRHAYDDMGRAIWVERLNESEVQVAWDYTYYNLTGDVEWKDSSRTNPEDYAYTRYDGAGRTVEQVTMRSRAKADGSGVEAVPGIEQYATTKFYYNLFGDLIKTMDPRGHTLRAEYDDIGRKTATEAYQGDWQNGGTRLARETTVYDDDQRKMTQTDARGGVTQIWHTSDGRPRRKVSPDGNALEWRYFLDGRIKRQPLSEHQYHEFTYNDTTRTVTKTLKNASGQTFASESATLDRRGNQVSATNLVGHVTTTTYDKVNRLMTTSVPAAGSSSAAQSTTTYHDATGQRKKTVNALGESIEIVSDAMGRPATAVVRDAANVIVSQSTTTYSADFHRATTTTGSGGSALTQSVWTDVNGKTVLVKHADGTYVRTEYDAAGNAIATTDETGQTTKTGYDGFNRVALTLLPDGAVTQFVYSYPGGGGQLVERRMPQSLTEVAITDAAGRPTESYLLGAGAVQSRRYHSYQYHASGKEKGLLKQYTDPRGLVHSVTYDDWQRPATTTVGTVGTATYVKRELLTYDLRGQVTQLRETTTAAVTEVLSAIDGQGHLEYQKTKLNGTVVTHLTNTYDGAGRRNGLARGGDVAAVGSGVGGSWGFGHRADGLLAGVVFGGANFNYTYGDSGLLKTRSNPFRAYTVPNSGGRDNRGRLLAAQTRLTGRSVDVLAEAVTWTTDSRQASYTATRLSANDGTGTATWQDARNYQYNAGRRQLVSENWVPGDGQPGRTQGHEHDFGQAGGLGIYTGRETPAPAGSTGSQLFLVNDAGMEGGSGIDAFGRVTREVSGFETLGLTAQGTAKGARDVELTVNNNGRLSGAQFEAATRFTTGAWSRQLWLPAGGYNLLAKGNHPSGQFSAQATAAFNLGVRHFGIQSQYDDDGNVSHRHVAGGFAQNGRSQTLTWDGLGRLVKVVQEEFGGFGYEWTATYDGLNRRLQTSYVPKRGNLYQTAEQVVERSWYDPQVEFMEIGLEVTRGSGGAAVHERWWKVHGPDLSGGYGGRGGMAGLEAMVNEANGQAVGTCGDAYGHIIGFAKAANLGAASTGAIVFEWNDARFGGYGPLSGTWSASIADGLSVWRSLGWRGKRLDATGFFYLGARYYEPTSGRFLSTDPMGHGASMSLYDYAGGDPINFVDPDGRLVKQQMENKAVEMVSEGGFLNNAGAYGIVFVMTAWDVFSLGTLSKNDELVDRNLAGEITDKQMYSGMAINTGVALGSVAIGGGTTYVAGRMLTSASSSVLTYTVVGGASGLTSGAADVLGTRLGYAGIGIDYTRTYQEDLMTVGFSTFGGAVFGGLSRGAEIVAAPRNVFSGHGAVAPGSFTVPQGTSIKVYGEVGDTISDRLGNAIELGYADDAWSRVYGPGSQAPNLILQAPDGLAIAGRPITVLNDTPLSSLLKPDMGEMNWAACLDTGMYKPYMADFDFTRYALPSQLGVTGSGLKNVFTDWLSSPSVTDSVLGSNPWSGMKTK